jgi:hypothetical protein
VTDEFPYPLTCKKSELHIFLEKNKFIPSNKKMGKQQQRRQQQQQRKFSVAIAYHVGMVNNWKVIVYDQITTLKRCGLLDIADKLMISYSNGNKTDLDQVFDLGSYGNSMTIDTVESTKVPWEGPALNMIHQYCKKQPLPETSVVFYLHNKGASKWSSDWKERMNMNQTRTYAHSLYWRKYLEYFLIESPALCLEKILLQNYSTCAANWHPVLRNHYSGNFWSASCKHIHNLKPMTNEDADYFAAEFWLGGYEGLDANQDHHANLDFTTENLYLHVIKPESYITTNYTKIRLP